MAHVLVTGSSGAIGQPTCRELLARGHHVRGLDRSATPGLRDMVLGELQDRNAVLQASAGSDCVLHLGAVPDDTDFAQLSGPNVLGLFHVLDAARRQQVPRVILASSIQVVERWWDCERTGPAPVTAASPSNHYALTKVWAEQMGEMYARCYGLQVLAARIAFMVRNRAEAQRLSERKQFDLYLSRADVARFCALAVEAPTQGFAVVYAVGRGGERLFDMDPARQLLGFEARDRWPEGLGFEPPPGTQTQGSSPSY
jgi:uronate dehydrogenase